MLHTENVARGGKLKCRGGGQTELPKYRGGGGGEGVYDVITLQKSRGGSSPMREERPPYLIPLNAVLQDVSMGSNFFWGGGGYFVNKENFR